MHHALQRVEGTLQLVPTKSGYGRNVKLSELGIDALKRHRRLQLDQQLAAGSEWSNEMELMFTTKKGTPLEATTPNRVMKRILKKAEIRDRRVHDLRHAAATILMGQWGRA